jgi:hypothetical protein
VVFHFDASRKQIKLKPKKSRRKKKKEKRARESKCIEKERNAIINNKGKRIHREKRRSFNTIQCE